MPPDAQRSPRTRLSATPATPPTSSYRNELARTMVLRALVPPLPIAWVAADATYGQDSRFRRFLEDAGLSYAVAVPKSQQVHGPRIEHLIGPGPRRGTAAALPRRKSQRTAALRVGCRPPAGGLGVRRQRAHRVTLDARRHAPKSSWSTSTPAVLFHYCWSTAWVWGL
ncbi:transposase [Streptomyces sp. NPDC057486]|uniref:transposase n=1 Tax=Streptomyces sp. NPDC057486 TaxID=3346145 RepID=UPI0036BF085D